MSTRISCAKMPLSPPTPVKREREEEEGEGVIESLKWQKAKGVMEGERRRVRTRALVLRKIGARTTSSITTGSLGVSLSSVNATIGALVSAVLVCLLEKYVEEDNLPQRALDLSTKEEGGETYASKQIN